MFSFKCTQCDRVYKDDSLYNCRDNARRHANRASHTVDIFEYAWYFGKDVYVESLKPTFSAVRSLRNYVDYPSNYNPFPSKLTSVPIIGKAIIVKSKVKGVNDDS